MNSFPFHPIGIFDSGLGGLTIARAISHHLPDESLIYFGDTAHLPYGEKSSEMIQEYSLKICDFLLEKDCKLILIACHSASTAAYDVIQEHVDGRALVVNVIHPVVNYVGQSCENKTVGLIGTKQTIRSRFYETKFNELNRGIQTKVLATPLLAPMIEEGMVQHHFAKDLLCKYLSDDRLANLDALVLGCTHYTLIKDLAEEFYQGRVDVIDGVDLIVEAVRFNLESANLLNLSADRQLQCYISDYTDSFLESTKLFFGEEVCLKYYPLWRK